MFSYHTNIKTGQYILPSTSKHTGAFDYKIVKINKYLNFHFNQVWISLHHTSCCTVFLYLLPCTKSEEEKSDKCPCTHSEVIWNQLYNSEPRVTTKIHFVLNGFLKAVFHAAFTKAQKPTVKATVYLPRHDKTRGSVGDLEDNSSVARTQFTDLLKVIIFQLSHLLLLCQKGLQTFTLLLIQLQLL